ncbi:hypothetical protein QOM21_08230 [Streptomyces sp. Pv4-95]|uniref:hypothetical protein n=1 Tax=Streptomyces sp. Pv4-95 TaxID=3049543 RepID=UPI003891DDB7
MTFAAAAGLMATSPAAALAPGDGEDPHGVTYSGATDSGYKTGASYHHNRWFDLDD